MKLELLEKCTICPHNCGINRTNNQIGRCKSKDTVKIALYSTHNFEEPCISGKKRLRDSLFFKLQYELCILSKL